MTPEAFPYVLLIIGVLTTAYGVFRIVRRVVHFFDALEDAAYNHNVAIALIIKEFSVNGGRIEAPIVDDLTARKATSKDLLLDMRALLHKLSAGQARHDKGADERVDRIIAGVKSVLKS